MVTARELAHLAIDAQPQGDFARADVVERSIHAVFEPRGGDIFYDAIEPLFVRGHERVGGEHEAAQAQRGNQQGQYETSHDDQGTKHSACQGNRFR